MSIFGSLYSFLKRKKLYQKKLRNGQCKGDLISRSDLRKAIEDLVDIDNLWLSGCGIVIDYVHLCYVVHNLPSANPTNENGE